jgi:predicted nucleic acid-binding protein
MSLLVADAGPLHYLVQIGAVEVMPALAGRVLLPEAVWRELREPAAAPVVREWAASLPPWVELRQSPVATGFSPQLSAADHDCIGLALETQAMLLMDDRRGRRAAGELGVRTIGTLGILEAASAKGLLPLADAIRRLRQTSIYLTDDLYAAALARDSSRHG